jgi:hypothetical protein
MHAGDAARQAIYAELQRVARAGRTTTYRDLAALAGLDLNRPADRDALAGTLRAISTAEHQQGRPLLSAVVVLGGRRLPGAGFFALARELRRHAGDDDAAFHRQELAQVYAAWQ